MNEIIEETTDKWDNVESMETTHEDPNPDSEVLYTMNIDSQEVNIMVDKETIEKRDVATEPPIENIAVEINVEDTVGNIEIGIKTHTEQSTDPLDTGKIDTTDVHTKKPTELEQPATDKSIEIPTMVNLEVHIEKPVENTETQSEKLAMESIEKPTEVHSKKHEEKKVQTETVPPTIAEKPKPLLVEMQTQTDLPKVNINKEVTHTGGLQIVKAVGQSSGSSLTEFKLTNIIEVLLDSIKKITEFNAHSYKTIDDTIPILKLIAPKCNVENKDSLSQLDALSKYITDNLLTIEQINKETFSEKMNKEKEKFFEESINRCKEHIDTLLPALGKTIMEFKELYRDTCKTDLLTVDIDKEISKVQKEINDIADNIIGSSESILVIEQEIARFEEKIEKLEKEKERIKYMAKELKCRLGMKLDILISLRKEISEALVPGLKTPEHKMHILTCTIQMIEATLKDSERFTNSLNFALADL